MSRRAHPYFGKINRIEEAGRTVPGGCCGLAPHMMPEEQQGILWNAFRERSEAA